jgi:hypothetical protein
MIIMRKKGVLQLALQFNFWVAMTIFNSMYFYVVNVIGQVVTHWKYDAIHCNSITKLIANVSKQLIFNYYATPLQL